jgi:hypothetical protein
VFIGLKKYPIAKKLFFASCRRLKAAGITFAQTNYQQVTSTTMGFARQNKGVRTLPSRSRGGNGRAPFFAL